MLFAISYRYKGKRYAGHIEADTRRNAELRGKAKGFTVSGVCKKDVPDYEPCTVGSFAEA